MEYIQVTRDNIESEHSLCGIHDEEKTSWLNIIKSIISQRLRGVSHFADIICVVLL